MRIIFVLFNFILFVHSMLFCQNINPIQARWCIRGEKGEYDETRSCLYSIQNSTSAKLLVFFIEENNDSLPPVQLLRRKLLRRYGDFSLSMLEWESNMIIEDSCAIIPELFVKCLLPKETFEIIIPFNSSDRENTKAVSTCKCTARKVKEYFRKNTQEGYENLIFLLGDGLFCQQLC